ncbi:hypothetical protein WN55_02770 [Dufourea novaeangliae]|uniref:Uncharacterized protein n=1 Tax=Dufourea novaeangliae TaxID=178035 RepID=A0A154NZI8_DUFNO|nr:hypothetical protein WN55_02770 [Dufourea novaeangliae]
MLKGSVNQLTDSQRELIAVGEKSVWFTNTYATARNSKSDYDHILEITQFGVYVPLNTPNNKSISKNLTTFNYTFQRKYSDGIGGPWVAILVNHFTPVSICNYL